MPNAYIKYVSENRARVAAKHPGKSPQEIMKLVAAEYRAKKGVKKGRGKSLEAILKEDAFPVKGNPDNLVGKPTPDGKSVWYKNDKPGEFPGTYAADPGRHLQDNVNNIFTKDGNIYINKRFMTPLMKGFGFGPLLNYKNPGKLGFMGGLVKGVLDPSNYATAYKFWEDNLAGPLSIVTKPISSLIGGKIGDAFNDALKNDLNEFFPEEKKQGSGARKIKRKTKKL